MPSAIVFGIKIFVARPSATSFIASMDLRRSTLSSIPASDSFLRPSASASYTSCIAFAWPSASAICASLSACAASSFACLSPSALDTTDSLCACASSTVWRLSRSARICFVITSSISAGGLIFLTSTRVTLMPHSSVASSRTACILPLISDLEDSVASNSISPIMLLRVVAVRF